MATSALRVRVRCPSVSPASVPLEGCTSDTTFADFRARVMKALGLEQPSAGGSAGRGEGGEEPNVDLPTILAGFPPKPLDLPDDVAIGSVLSDNENVTVRLASKCAGGANPEGGTWGRSRKKPKGPSCSVSSSTPATSSRASVRGPRSATSSTANSGANSQAGEPAPATADTLAGITGKGKSKAKPKENQRGASPDGSGSSGGGGSVGGTGVHTLSGPLTPSPSAASRRSGPMSGGVVGLTAILSPQGQVRALFGGSSGRSEGSRITVGGAGDTPAGRGQASVGGPTRKRVRPATGVALRSEADIGETLLRAVSGGGQGTADKFFRKAMRLAVDKQYDQSRADARVRAAMGKWYTAEADAGQRRLGDGQSVAMKISFSKGDGAKSQFEETVDRIPRLQVAAVVRMIARDPESREMLKPHNMAGCSPRMFWSLVEHWGGDIPAALRRAAPDIDWDFLETRDRKPSEKAIANALAEDAERRQVQEEREERDREKQAKRKERERKKRKRQGLPSESSGEEEGGSASVIAELAAGSSSATGETSESCAEQLAAAAEAEAQAEAKEARRRAADAALARLAASQPADTVNGTAAAESSAPRTAAEGAVVATAAAEEVEADVKGLAAIAGGEAGAKLLMAAGVRTVGQLADRDVERLAHELQAIQTGSANGSVGGGGGVDETVIERGTGEGGGAGDSERGEEMEGKDIVGAEKISEWVQAARGEELDEIMYEVVGSDDDVMEALEEVSVATPRDLVRLGKFPDILIYALKDKLGAERFTPLEEKITTEAIATWRANGDRVLQERPWLELWVSG